MHFLRRRNIKPIKKFNTGRGNNYAFYDRAECERARPFINQPEQKEVEKVEEKQMELPEPKEQTPDIILADTIDLFTMPELEAELKNRGVELTAEVRAKINASDMPEMQHIATMLRGNTKTIAISLSTLNEIADKFSDSEHIELIAKNSTLVEFEDKHGKPGNFYIDEELKSCPFCGGTRIEIFCEELQNDYWLATIICCECECKNEHDESTKEGAAEELAAFWNRRSSSDRGRKNKHRPEFDKIAFDMASANKTDAEIGKALNISIDTFYRYKKTISSFAEALDRGRAANPFAITDSQGRERSNRYFELKDFMEMQKQLNDMQKMIEMLSKKLDGVGVVEKKIYMKNNKVDKVIVTETKLEDKK